MDKKKFILKNMNDYHNSKFLDEVTDGDIVTLKSDDYGNLTFTWLDIFDRPQKLDNDTSNS